MEENPEIQRRQGQTKGAEQTQEMDSGLYDKERGLSATGDILEGKIHEGQTIHVDAKNGALQFNARA